MKIAGYDWLYDVTLDIEIPPRVRLHRWTPSLVARIGGTPAWRKLRSETLPGGWRYRRWHARLNQYRTDRLIREFWLHFKDLAAQAPHSPALPGAPILRFESLVLHPDDPHTVAYLTPLPDVPAPQVLHIDWDVVTERLLEHFRRF